jgi:hypothetical protein
MSDTVTEFREALRNAAEVLGRDRPEEVKVELSELVATLSMSFGNVSPFVAAAASLAAVNRYRLCDLFNGFGACRECAADAAMSLLMVSCALTGVPALRLLERIGVLAGIPEGMLRRPRATWAWSRW